jgi:hypothetical protein
LPSESTIVAVELAPGTITVINDPPIDPELGDTDTSFGVRVSEVSNTPSGIPTSKNKSSDEIVGDVTFVMVKIASDSLIEEVSCLMLPTKSSTEL